MYYIKKLNEQSFLKYSKKFFPENYGVKITMYIGKSESIMNPQYNPLDPDNPDYEGSLFVISNLYT